MNGKDFIDILIIPLDSTYEEWYRINKLWQIRTLIGTKDKKPRTLCPVSIKNSNE